MGRKNTQRQRNCLCCGTRFSYHAYREHEAKYCSRQCYFDHKSRPAMERANFVEDENGCWNWQGYVCPDGYGRMGVRRRSQVAHRAIYEEVVAEIPPGMVLDHKCRNRACVNPDHLHPVTIGQNNHLGKVMRAVFAWRGMEDPSAKHHG